jgi:hypothetical protein
VQMEIASRPLRASTTSRFARLSVNPRIRRFEAMSSTKSILRAIGIGLGFAGETAAGPTGESLLLNYGSVSIGMEEPPYIF